METLSRVKRYEDLRKQIEDDSIGNDTLPEEKLQNYAQRINEIDPSIFKKVTISDEEPYTPERERKVTESYEDVDNTMGEFRNEYLDDFINEVREYNMKKGNRENENTQIDILNKLNAVSRAKRADYVERIEEDGRESEEPKDVLNRDEIAAQVKSMVEAENGTELQSEAMKMPTEAPLNQETIANAASQDGQMEEGYFDAMPEEARANTLQVQQIKQAAQAQTIPMRQEEEHNSFVNRTIRPTAVITKEEQTEIEREKRLHQKLVEETQQLRVQLNEYEDDLNDLSEGVEKTNKMLNIILGCLILALLVIIGIVIYWIVQAGGLV